MRTYVYTVGNLESYLPEEWGVEIGEWEIASFDHYMRKHLAGTGAQAKIEDATQWHQYSAGVTPEEAEQDEAALSDAVEEWVEDIRQRVLAGEYE